MNTLDKIGKKLADMLFGKTSEIIIIALLKSISIYTVLILIFTIIIKTTL